MENIFIFIPVENQINLLNQLKQLRNEFQNKIKNYCCNIVIIDSSTQNQVLHNQILLSEIKQFHGYNVIIENGTIGEKTQSLLQKITDDRAYFLLLQQDNINENYQSIINDIYDNKDFCYYNNSFLCQLASIRNIAGVDKRCQSIPDVISDIKIKKNNFNINELKSLPQWLQRKYNKLQQYRNYPIIYIDGALGDHINSIPLIRSYSEGVYVCALYPQIINHIKNIKGFVEFSDIDIGGFVKYNEDDIQTYSNGFNVYLYGSNVNPKSLAEGFCRVYGKIYNEDNFSMKEIYNNKSVIDKINEEIKNNIGNSKYVCLSIHASKNNNIISNKNWNDTYWMQVIFYLKKMGYKIVYIGSKTSVQFIPHVDYYITDRTQEELIEVLTKSSFTLCVDTYTHHLCSYINAPVICLNTYNNEHAMHNNCTYITKKDESVKVYTNKWWLDIQQKERKNSMNQITVEDVIGKMNDFILQDKMLYKEL